MTLMTASEQYQTTASHSSPYILVLTDSFYFSEEVLDSIVFAFKCSWSILGLLNG